jgi:putative transcriptional regulator
MRVEPANLREGAMKWVLGEIAFSPDPARSLRTWRERFGIGQAELAKSLGVSPSVISDYESGRRKSPGLATVRKIVEAMFTIDEQKGGVMLKSLSHLLIGRFPSSVVLEIREYSKPVEGKVIVEAVKGEIFANEDILTQKLFGHTVIDSLQAILSLSAEEFRYLYGLSTERVLAFTQVSTGRSPMIAVRVMGITPGMMVLHGQLREPDALAVKLAQILRVPLVVSRLPTVDDLIKAFRSVR